LSLLEVVVVVLLEAVVAEQVGFAQAQAYR
jgi:hypothetical protein